MMVFLVRSDDEVRALIVSAAEFCVGALLDEADYLDDENFLAAAECADRAEWDAVRAFAMARRWS